MVKPKKIDDFPVPKKGINTANRIKGISIKDLLKTVSRGSFAISITLSINAKKRR
jgi:hypothetical protein